MISQNDQLPGGAFIRNTEQVAYSPYRSAGELFLTQEGNTGLKEELLKLINQSTQVLKICSFIITDTEIYEAIRDRAENSDVTIFILTQLDESALVNESMAALITEEELKEKTGAVHLRHIKQLYDLGVHVRASVAAHAKFVICDRTKGFITSANLTSTSLTLNTESGVYLSREDSVELDKLFDVVFQTDTGFRQFVNTGRKNKMMVVQETTSINSTMLPDTSKSNLRYTCGVDQTNLYREIIRIVSSADDYLYLSAYSIVGLEKLPELTNSIQQAVQRGVIVNVFCRGMNQRHDHRENSGKLAELGCHIFADHFNHSKGIINENTGLLFTANIDGDHGLINGFEVGCILDENKRAEFLDFHKSLIDSAFYRFDSTPVRRVIFETGLLTEQYKKNQAPSFPREIIILRSDSLSVSDDLLINHLLYYGKKKADHFLIAGNRYFRCEISANVFKIVEKSKTDFQMERYILKYNQLTLSIQP